MKISEITPVIITKNAQKHLAQTLQSLQPFKRVILFDNGSTDETTALARTFKNVSLIEGDFHGFGPTKNIAAEYAPTDWILSIDADEIVTQELLTSLANLALSDPTTLYKINRRNLFMGKAVKHSGWNPDWLIRLYNRSFTAFSNQQVHESVLVPAGATIVPLKGRLDHYAIDDISDFLQKTATYSRLPRDKMKTLSPVAIFSRALFAFIKTFFIKRGFLDGARGLTIAVSNFNGVFFKYMHLYFQSDKA